MTTKCIIILIFFLKVVGGMKKVHNLYSFHISEEMLTLKFCPLNRSIKRLTGIDDWCVANQTSDKTGSGEKFGISPHSYWTMKQIRAALVIQILHFPLFHNHSSSFTILIHEKKNAYALKTPHIAVFIAVTSVSRFFANSICEIIDDLQKSFHWNTHWHFFWPCDLDLWLWPWPTNLT